MGWWKIDDKNGSIACSLPAGHDGKSVCNAVPDKHAPDDNHNGDGPADVIDAAIKEVDKLYQDAWGRPPTEFEMRAALNFCYNGWVHGRENPQPELLDAEQNDDLSD